MNTVQRVRAVAELIERAYSLMQHGPMSYYLEEMAGAYEHLLSKYAPFKVGDRVTLTRAPQINAETGWGWMGSKHFLIPGAVATVQHVYYSSAKKALRYEVMFDNETWIDHDGKERAVSEKHTYNFGDDHLCAVHSEGKENG